MRNFAEKLKSDKKTRTVVICTSLAAVALIVAAIAIPVVIHNNRIPKEAQAAQTTTPSELTTHEVSTTQAVTVPETAESTEPPTTAPTTAAGVSKSRQNSKPTSNTTKKSASGSSGASSSTPKPNTGSSNQKPVTATQVQSSQWTQAEVDALVSEIKAYAQSKGFAINPSKGKVGTTWPNPIHAGKDKSKTKADLKETVDFFCGLAIEELGSVTGSINVFAEKYTDSNGLPQWEVYVVR